jgi:hypothetical protein
MMYGALFKALLGFLVVAAVCSYAFSDSLPCPNTSVQEVPGPCFVGPVPICALSVPGNCDATIPTWVATNGWETSVPSPGWFSPVLYDLPCYQFLRCELDDTFDVCVLTGPIRFQSRPYSINLPCLPTIKRDSSTDHQP